MFPGADHVEKRHAEILGMPQRIPTPDPQAVLPQVQAATNRLRQSVLPNAKPLPVDAIPQIMFTMLPYGELWEKIMDLSIAIQGPTSLLPFRDRKLAILRIGWLCQAPYEFGEHVAQSKALGFTSEEIDRVIIGSDAPGWDEHERAILLASEELHNNAMIDDATWETLAKRLTEAQLVEMLVLIGQFTATAYFQNALRLRLERGNTGLVAR